MADDIDKKPVQLVPEEFLLRHLMEETNDCIYFKDLESRFIKVSPSTARGFGLSSPILAIGKTDYDFFTREHAHQAFVDEQKIIRTGEPIINKVEKETWRSDRVTWVSTTKMPIRDDKGEIIGTWGISRDITARREAQQENKKLIAELKALKGVE